jgi:hypothetical protein
MILVRAESADKIRVIQMPLRPSAISARTLLMLPPNEF